MADDILERRKRLLQQRLAGQVASVPETVAAVRRGADPSPLSDAQRRMWFVQRLDPEDTTLNICVAYRLTGDLDPGNLRSACAEVVARHEILRTTYHVDESGEPYQVSADDHELSWQEHDLTEQPETGRQRRVEVLAQREFARPFDLTRDGALRMTLVRTGATEHVLILTSHHIGWDDDCWPVFFAEVNGAYRGVGLPVLQAQYVDIEAARPRNPARDAADLEYWRDVLTPLPGRLELPGRSAASGSTRAAETRTRALPDDLLTRAAAVGRTVSATPFVVLLAGFQALIRRYTAATDFLITVPVTDRSGRGSDALLGYFGNTVLIRATPEREFTGRDATFANLLESTAQACTGAFAHQGTGIDQVVRAVSPERGTGRDGLAQLVQLSFAMRGAADGFDLPGVEATELPLASAVAQEELGLMVVSDAAGTRVEATYLVDHLEQRTVDQLLDHYLQLLDSVLDRPDLPLAEIDFLGADRAAVLDASHGSFAEYTPTTLVAQLEARVAATPERVAVVSDEIELDYAGLNARANRLAHWLIAKGIGPEDIVALSLATSVDFVIAAWAVLKSGAAYLPIDPDYPVERIEYLLADARPRIVFGEASYAEAVAAAQSLSETNPGDSDRMTPLYPGNTAYVIYTSGSTGRPKGVPVPHAAIAEHLSGFSAEWDLTPQDRVLQSTSVSFDASLMDIFVTLYVGARVVIPKPNAYRDIPYVADLVARQGVSVLHMVPSMLATFLMLPEINDWTELRHMPVGGEALPGEVADRFTERFDAQLRNHYGPTEAVVCSTHMPVEGPQGTGIVPIGVPNRNVALYLLDDALQLVPNGVVGEIYLGGDQLARGYLSRFGLTAQRFVADPFRTGQRLYRTGDLGRRGAHGVIEFIGRTDEQVKVRGHRIELGEIESAINGAPDIAHSVVVVTEHPSLGQILAAYPVPLPGAEIDLDSLRNRVAARLPEYMVPAAFTVIDRIPLTTHGKLDRRALPAPELALNREFREPASPTERRIAELYGRLFDQNTIGADDSFFELGGHSLLAARLISMIRAEFGLEIDMRVPFDTPTVSGLAAHIVAEFLTEFGIDIDDMAEFEDIGGAPAADTSAKVVRPALVRRERPEKIPLSYSQRAYWLQRRMEGAVDGENVTYPVRFDGPLDIDALRAAVADVAARHDCLRTTFPESEGTPYQRIAAPAPIPLPIIDLREGDAEPAEQLERELGHDAEYIFDLQTEAQLRVRLLIVDEQTHVLSILMHHIIADRRSCHIFIEDLLYAYRARLAGTAPDRPELEIQFADFSLWQREIFDRAAGHGEVSAYGKELLDYWCEALDGIPDEISVAHDRPRPTVLGRNGVSTTRVIPAATWQAARRCAEKAGATDFMLCQAMSAVTLHALGAGDDLPIGAAVSNRLDEKNEEMIGLFANMIVLRNDLSGNPTPRAVLARVRDSALDAITRQGVPFERLVETINPPRSLARNPLFQVVMHFRNRVQPADLTGDGATTVTSIAKYYEVSFMDIHFDYTVETNGDLTTRVVVNTDLYEAATGALFADVLARVAAGFATAPDSAVSALDVLPPEWDPGRVVVRHRTEIAAVPASGEGATLITETERTIGALLAELLEIDEVGREDGFFALGGDSVIAVQLSARASEAGLPLAPQLLFEYFTIADLAAAVDELIANPPEVDPENQEGREADRQNLAPMEASGLDADALQNLQAAWSAKG